MPEGPELHVAGLFINRVCENRIFTGKVLKSAVSTKNPDIPWEEPAYKISATTRGKEVKLTLTAVHPTEATDPSGVKMKANDIQKQKSKNGEYQGKKIEILFRFGMSGKFKFVHKDDMDKHCHLNFFTDTDDYCLSFNDYRRFGRWELTDEWGKNRGPCVILEYDLFRENILNDVERVVFKKPICEVLLDQKYFNGVGNYLRAEILYRLNIPPFVSAQSVLQPVHAAQKAGVKSEKPDILQLCHDLPMEVLALNGGRGHVYDPRDDKEGFASFLDWLQCYYKDGMNNMVDHNGRTMWFIGQAGPLKPKDHKTRGRVERKRSAPKEKEKESEESANEEKGPRNSAPKKTLYPKHNAKTVVSSPKVLTKKSTVSKKGTKRQTTNRQSAKCQINSSDDSLTKTNHKTRGRVERKRSAPKEKEKESEESANEEKGPRNSAPKKTLYPKHNAKTVVSSPKVLTKKSTVSKKGTKRQTTNRQSAKCQINSSDDSLTKTRATGHLRRSSRLSGKV